MKRGIFLGPTMSIICALLACSSGEREDELEYKCSRVAEIMYDGAYDFCTEQTCCFCECLNKDEDWADEINPCSCAGKLDKLYEIIEVPSPISGEQRQCTIKLIKEATPFLSDDLDWCIENTVECQQSGSSQANDLCH